MSIEILTIGDELMRGDLVDTNASWLASKLHDAGLEVGHIGSTGDSLEQITAAVRQGIGRSSVLITSGGLGPTDDDRTIAAVAAVCERDLVLDQAALEHIQALFAKIGLVATPNNEKQAWIPRGARALKNERGTAPGVQLSLASGACQSPLSRAAWAPNPRSDEAAWAPNPRSDEAAWAPNRAGDRGCEVFCLPGVPRELKSLFERYIAPWLQEAYGAVEPARRVIKFFGVGESQIDHALRDLTEDLDHGESIHFRATFPETHVTVLVRPGTPVERDSAVRRAEKLADDIASRLPQHVFAIRDITFSEAIVECLRTKQKRVALAESCTAGLVGDLLTRASGASEVFELGIVAYANRIKRDVLKVPEAVLARDGAVSRECVEAMARGVLELSDADFGLGISGIAGPTGGTTDKPVGTIHVALAGRSRTDGSAETRILRHLHRVFPYDRNRNRQLAAHVALWLVYRALNASVDGEQDVLAGRWMAKGQAF